MKVEKKDGNLMVRYQMFLENNKSGSSSSQTQQATQKSTNNQVASQGNKQTAPVMGGFKVINDPLKSKNVMNVLSFLMNKVNKAVKYASLIKAEVQVVHGYNFKLTITFDSSSTAVYVIIVHQSTKGKCTVKSIQLQNVSKEPKFASPLTAQQIQKLTFLGTLKNLIIKE